MKKRILITSIASFLIFICLGFLSISKLNEYSQKQVEIDKIDWIMVLANGDKVTPTLQDRLNNSIMASQLWPQAKILLTGNDRVHEVKIMKDYLLGSGIGSERIIEETESTSTWTNFKNSKKLIPDAAMVLIITNEFHQRRSLATANLMGFKAALFGKDTVKFTKAPIYALREYLSGIKWYFQYGLYKLGLC